MLTSLMCWMQLSRRTKRLVSLKDIVYRSSDFPLRGVLAHISQSAPHSSANLAGHEIISLAVQVLVVSVDKATLHALNTADI